MLKSYSAVHKRSGDAVGRRELGSVSVLRPLLGGKRFPKAVQDTLGRLANDAANLRRLAPFLLEPQCTIDERLNHRPARIGLEGELRRMPIRAEIARQRLPLSVGRMRKAVE